MTRKIKKEPALAMEIGKDVVLFPVGESKGGDGEDGFSMDQDAVSELWTFV